MSDEQYKVAYIFLMFAGVYVGIKSPDKKMVGWGVAIVFAVLLIYSYFAQNQKPVEKCPKVWDRENSPVCPAGTRTNPDTSKCSCVVCEDEKKE
jgi:hypothetical protein